MNEILEAGADDFEKYLKDASNIRGKADKVYFPKNTAEISVLIGQANQESLAVTIAGAGTGLSGARVPDGGLVISTERMNRIGPVIWDEQQKKGHVTVQPGAVLKDFEAFLDRQGLFYPPDPTGIFASIGGTVATNASGARSFKYGPTRRYVRRLEVVLANGDILDIQRGEHPAKDGCLEVRLRGDGSLKIKIPSYQMPAVKNAAGYYAAHDMDLIDLFIGQEGTLGAVSGIELEVFQKPEALAGGILFFTSEAESYYFMTGARHSARSGTERIRMNPRVLEFFDRYSLERLSRIYPEIPEWARAAIFFEQECSPADAASIGAQWHRDGAWISAKNAELERFRKFRQDLPFMVRDEIREKGYRKIGTDMAVPDANGETMLKFYLDKLPSSGIAYLLFGHFGDNHLHANLFPGTDEEFFRAKLIYDEFVDKALALGGTVSAEHGIGKLKVPYLERMYGREGMREMAFVKRILDPKGILSPGNIISKQVWHEVALTNRDL